MKRKSEIPVEQKPSSSKSPMQFRDIRVAMTGYDITTVNARAVQAVMVPSPSTKGIPPEKTFCSSDGNTNFPSNDPEAFGTASENPGQSRFLDLSSSSKNATSKSIKIVPKEFRRSEAFRKVSTGQNVYRPRSFSYRNTHSVAI
jgi:hypothetical protein